MTGLIQPRKAYRVNNPRMVSWKQEKDDWVAVYAKYQLGLYSYLHHCTERPNFWVEDGMKFWCDPGELKDLEPTFVIRAQVIEEEAKKRHCATRPSKRKRKT